MSAVPQPNGTPPPGGRRNLQRSLHSVSPLRRLFFGKPIETARQEHAQLRKLLALPVFASDAISSVAYASQEILLVLGLAGLWTLSNRALYTQLTLGVTVGIVCLLAIVVFSYSQTIYAYPHGGGSYIVTKDNLGTTLGLVAASAVLIDYVLTVAVSIASGVQNLVATPIAQHYELSHYSVHICLVLILAVAYLNLRGLRESGAVFAVPTYTFVGMALLMIVLGLVGEPLFGWQLHRAAVDVEYQRAVRLGAPHATGLAGLAGLALIPLALRAFANGCSAMTGTEAVADGIPSFRAPQSRNAALTLLAMGCVLGTLFLGISLLATKLHVVYLHYGHESSPAVIDQLSSAVFGRSGPVWRQALYYIMQFATLFILVVAAQTSFADFPRLSAILARDRFMPRQMANQGDKLSFTNGILLLGLFAGVLIVAFRGNVDRLIPLYAVGVFTAFTLSQAGMVARWRKLRTPGWWIKGIINGFGATCTGVVLLLIASEKWREGAWIAIVAAALLIVVLMGIHRHYEFIRSRLSLVNYHPAGKPCTNTVLLMVPSLHRGIMPALEYARSISPDCRAIHVETDPADTPRLVREWEQFVGEEPPLVVLPSPYRSLIGPLLAYLDQVQRERANHVVTVVVPEFVPGKWWHAFLHNANGVLVKYYLSHRPGVIVSNFRYFLGGTLEDPVSAACEQLPT